MVVIWELCGAKDLSSMYGQSYLSFVAVLLFSSGDLVIIGG